MKDQDKMSRQKGEEKLWQEKQQDGKNLEPMIRPMDEGEVKAVRVQNISDGLKEMVRPMSRAEVEEVISRGPILPPVKTEEASEEKKKNLIRMVYPMMVVPMEKVSSDKKTTEVYEKKAKTYTETISEKSIAKEKEKKAPEEKEKSYGNFTLKILQKSTTIEETADGEERSITYLIEVVVDDRDVYTISVPGEKLENLAWLTKGTGGAAYIDSTNNKAREQVLKILHDQISAQIFKGQTRYLQNGWKEIDGKWGYVIDNGIIGKDFCGIRGDAEFKFMYNKEAIGQRETFLQAMGMIDICHDKTVSVPLFVFTHMGVMNRLFELSDVPIKVVLALTGTTNSRKTSLGLCLTKIFNRDDLSNAEITFDSTPGGIEIMSSQYADAVLLIDDFHPSSTRQTEQKLMANLELILRRYGDRVMKRRMTDYSVKGKEYPVKGLCVITGEDIGGVQSSLTRAWTLDMDRKTVNLNKLTYYQENKLILTTHLYDFIRYVTENFEEIKDLIGKSTKRFRAEKKTEIPRYNEYFGQFMAAGKVIVRYAISRGFWDVSETEDWLRMLENTLNIVIEKNLRIVRMEDFGILTMSALKSVMGENGVIDIKDLHGNNISYHEIVSDEHFYYVEADFLLETTKRYAARFGKTLPFHSKRQMTIFLDNLGVIQTKREGDDLRRTLPFPGHKKRVVYIIKEKMWEILAEATV